MPRVREIGSETCCHCEPRRGEAISNSQLGDCFVGLRPPRHDTRQFLLFRMARQAMADSE